jgi:hypothetical protein
MIKVLHIFPKDDHTNARYVALLAKALPDSIESLLADDPVVAKKMCKEQQPDIVHLYGVGRYEVTGRRVISPCGTPFDSEQPYYAVVARSPLEAESLFEQEVKRVEIIRNPLVTKTASFDETAQKMAYVYQKVMDSNPWPLMDDATRSFLFMLLKVAVCGDKRWLAGATVSPQDVNFRLLFHYAEKENILSSVQKGLAIMGIEVPEHQKIACYLPNGYAVPVTMSGQDIVSLLHDVQKHGLSLLRLLNVFEALHESHLNEDQLLNMLETEELLMLFRSILSIAQELLSLEEGFMPCESIDNAETRKLKDNIINHLRL